MSMGAEISAKLLPAAAGKNNIYELVKSSEETFQANWFVVAVSEKMQLEINYRTF